LARYGIKTVGGGSGVVARLGETKFIAKPVPKGQVYPVSPEEVKTRLQALPKADLKGLKTVEFVPPRDKDQEDAWAQMVRSRKSLLIFSQKAGPNGEVSGMNPKQVSNHMKNYVIPHEIGHHVALTTLETDKDLSMAEARADAYAAGMSVKDSDAKVFKSRHE
jgi:hypothetical protein